jgi:hypothetical protein
MVHLEQLDLKSNRSDPPPPSGRRHSTHPSPHAHSTSAVPVAPPKHARVHVSNAHTQPRALLLLGVCSLTTCGGITTLTNLVELYLYSLPFARH